MRKTSVKLPDDLADAWKVSGVPLRELIRRGLGAADGGTPAPETVAGGGIWPNETANLALSGDWVTVQEAAAALGISESRVHHLLSVGYLESRKADGGWRRQVSAESVRVELDRRECERQGARPPYADAASIYQAEADAAWRTAPYTAFPITRKTRK